MPKTPDASPVTTRNLSKKRMIEAAINLMEEVGQNNFSVRKLGDRVGCDPMAILYHFKNKDGLLRNMADALLAKLETTSDGLSWDEQLSDHAHQYRKLAQNHPHTFPLIQKFLHTGLSDLPHIEMVHGALAKAGIAENNSPAVCLAWYASIIGLCMGEIQGLIRTASATETYEIRLQENDFPRLSALIPAYQAIETDNVFEIANTMLIAGIKHQATKI